MKTPNEIKENLFELIEEKLKEPNISASDICALSQAYSELTKNDFLEKMWDQTSSFGMVAPPVYTADGPECQLSSEGDRHGN